MKSALCLLMTLVCNVLWAQTNTDGPIVTFTNVQKDGTTTFTLYINENNELATSSSSAAELGDAAKFRAIPKENGKWAFYNESKSLYMIWRGKGYGHNGDKYFWPLSYSSAKTAQKRMDKLEKAGIRCKLTGYNGGCIEFLGYTPETEALLEKERQEVIIAHRAWQAKQYLTI